MSDLSLACKWEAWQVPGPRAGFTPATQVPLMQWLGTGASEAVLGVRGRDVGKAGLDLGDPHSQRLWHSQ